MKRYLLVDQQRRSCIARTVAESIEEQALDERGAIMAEGAIAFGFLLVFFITSLSFITVVFQSYFVEHALRRTARWAVLGQTLPGNNRIDSIQLKFEEYASHFGVPVTKTQLRICPLGQPACTANISPVTSQMFFLGYPHTGRLIYPGLDINIDLGVMARNEPF